MRIALLTALFFLPLSPALCGATWRWIEGESADPKSVSPELDSSPDPGQLSGGAWISHRSGSQRGSVQYSVQLPEKRSYYLWLRADPVETTIAARFNEGGWFRARLDRRQRDITNVAAGDDAQLRFLAWSRVGVVPLEAGENSIEFRFQSTAENRGAIDCFCLTTDADWLPRGRFKPGEKRPQLASAALSDSSLDQWVKFIRPDAAELKWRDVRWHQALSDAAGEARALGRPILLWTMNGHPCGET